MDGPSRVSIGMGIFDVDGLSDEDIDFVDFRYFTTKRCGGYAGGIRLGGGVYDGLAGL